MEECPLRISEHRWDVEVVIKALKSLGLERSSPPIRSRNRRLVVLKAPRSWS
ncbi:hypothetical protein [Metallosphaera yellowstonensis]|uniref:hypothetical protein n=1 Tax=Metallosphaera yellowstonensis TaxID=1111107 RepID=UPI0012DEAB73|nr:hypothetical protein [Metallosphaera yellowstonensis]